MSAKPKARPRAAAAAPAGPAALAAALSADAHAALEKATVPELVAFLEAASRAYYMDGRPLVPDELYDLARDALEAKDPGNAFLAAVGAPVPEGDRVKLPYWMGSLDKIRDDPKALARWEKAYPGAVVVSDKLDGNSGLLVYGADGRSMALYSRGNGDEGQDISHLLPYIQGVPAAGPAMAGYAVRGELILSKKDWDAISHMGANARNMVAGAMHRKTPDPELARRIVFVAYGMLAPKGRAPSQQMAEMARAGFRVAWNDRQPAGSGLTMDGLSAILMRRRAESPFEIDGVVVAQDEAHPLVRGRNPRHAFAFKTLLTHEEAEVVVSSVSWALSKDGYYKPTILFPPVHLAGAKISRATGFNAAYIEANRIGPGARVIVIRSGDVIPKVQRVLAGAAAPAMPGDPFEWNETHVEIRVPAGNADAEAAAGAILVRKMEHLVSTLDIKGVGPAILASLHASGIAPTLAALMHVRAADIVRVEGFQKRSAENIEAAFARARERATCAGLMAASNAFGRGFGEKRIAPILAAFPGIADRRVPTRAELEGIPGVGPKVAEAFLAALPAFYRFVDEVGIPCRIGAAAGPAAPAALAPAPAKRDGRRPLAADMVVVFTGFRAKAWEDAIVAAGGRVATSVSGKTTLVVAADPDEASGKLERARGLGIPIMGREAFQRAYQVPTDEA